MKQQPKAHSLTDKRGQCRNADLAGPLRDAPPDNPSTKPRKKQNIYAQGRCWPAPLKGAYARWIDANGIPLATRR